MAHTEFWAGVLVVNFPEDYQKVFEQMQALPDTPLPELLTRFTAPACAATLPDAPSCGILVVISGLDYHTFRLTPQSQIRKLAAQIGR